MEKKRNFFTLKRSKHSVTISNTNLEPKALAFLGGNFIGKYREQLDKLLEIDVKEEKDLAELFTLLMIVEAIEDNEYPMNLHCNLTTVYKRDVMKVLEKFIKDNQRELHLIKEIYLSFVERSLKQE